MSTVIAVIGTIFYVIWSIIKWIFKIVFSILSFPIKLFLGKRITDVSDDPIIDDIVQFIDAASKIPQKTDFHQFIFWAYQNGTARCIFAVHDHCYVTYTEEQIRKYGRNTPENLEHLRKELNIDAFPKGIVYELEDDFEGYSLTYENRLLYPKAYQLYHDAVIRKCNELNVTMPNNFHNGKFLS